MRAELPDEEPERPAASTALAVAIVLAAGAAVGGLAYLYGRWDGQRPRRIRAEQQLDMVTEAARRVRDLMRDAAPPPEHPSKDAHPAGPGKERQ